MASRSVEESTLRDYTARQAFTAAASSMIRTLVIIPALNEEAALPAVLDSLRRNVPDYDVVVIDDGSTDRTVAVARGAGVTVVSLPYNMGVGTALRTGFRYAHRHGYDRVVQTDADGQHDPAQIDLLLQRLDDGADLVIGSRFMARDGHYAVDRSRGAAMQVLRAATKFLIGRTINDSTSGFRAFSAALVSEFSQTYPREFLSDTVEALLMASYAGFRVDEVPVRMSTRAAGEPSHGGVRMALQYIRLLTVMGLTMSFASRRAARKAAP